MGDGLVTSMADTTRRPGADGTGAATSGPDRSGGPDTTTLDTPAWMGRLVGRYRLLAHIGTGSVGKVFRAEDVDLHRHVGLKIIANHQEDPAAARQVRQLIAEARAAARLAHPHVVHVYDIGGVGDVYYIAMEMVDGGCLQTTVEREGRLDVGRACRLVCEAAEALHYAHQNGIVHRDVKPANLMLTRDDRVKLADFGLACEIDPEPPDGEDEHPSVGTPLYIAPEVIRNQAATPQSDVYSLGGTLWFLLTGRPVFPREMTALIVAAHLLDPLPDLRALRPGLPPGLADVVAKALAKDPADRYPTAEAFAQALRPYAEAPGDEGAGPAAKSYRWRPGLMAALAAVVLIVALVISFALVWQSYKFYLDQRPPPPAQEQPQQRTLPAAPAVRGIHAIDAHDVSALLRNADGQDPAHPAGEEVAVDGVVTATEMGPENLFFRIHFTAQDQEGTFVADYRVALAPRMQEQFPSPPRTQMLGLVGNRVRVTGKVERFNGRPRILIESPDQVTILD